MDFIRNFPLFSIVLSLFSGVLCTMLKGRHTGWKKWRSTAGSIPGQ